MGTIGKRSGGPWYGESRRLILFELGARRWHPSLHLTKLRGGGRWYGVTLEVPHYGVRRHVTIGFLPGSAQQPMIHSYGPTKSPHRYSDNRLCVWYPLDPRDQRWVPEDGLANLIVLILLHLFKEEWWREMGEWLGPEIHPAPGTSKDSHG